MKTIQEPAGTAYRGRRMLNGIMVRRKSRQEGPHPVDVHVGYRVRLRRTQLGMSQAVLGDKVGITFQQIQKYERGHNRISASTLYGIGKALEAPIEYFFEDLAETPTVEMQLGTLDAYQSFLTSADGRKLVEAVTNLPQSVRTKLISLAVAIHQAGDNDEGNVVHDI